MTRRGRLADHGNYNHPHQSEDGYHKHSTLDTERPSRMGQDLDREAVTGPAQSPEASRYFTPHLFPRLFPICSLPSGRRAVGLHCHCGLLCQGIKEGGLAQPPYVTTLAGILRLRL